MIENDINTAQGAEGSVPPEVTVPHLIPYNTGLPRVVLPEYGRNIQQMASHCLRIEDRDERTRCATAVVEVMATLFPEMVGERGDRQKLWDHLNIMTDFSLDIDFPVEVTPKDNLNIRPQKIPYTDSRAHHRQYGRIVQRMAPIISDMPNTDEKDAMVSMLAHHMKKLMTMTNREGVSNARVLNDLANFTAGGIVLDPDTYVLHDFMEPEPVVPARGKKKKKKNNN